MPDCTRDDLAALYLPQVEQFGIELKPRGCALVGSQDNDIARAEVCVYPIGDACCVTSHRILMRKTLPFREHHMPGLCVCTLSADSLALSPIAQPDRAHPAGNVAVFGEAGEDLETRLLAGSMQNAVSVMFLPRWMRHLEAGERRDMARLIEEPGTTYPDDLAPAIDVALSSLTPLFGGGLADAHRLLRTSSAIAASSLAWYRERTRAENATGTHEQARLVRLAKRTVAQRLGEGLTLDALAHDLLTSRSRLCAAFKAETGEGLATYVRQLRMARAAELLERTPLDVAEVARQVGYPRTSSFTVAFEREHRLSPSAWRAGHRPS